ncbi:hypothetical protein E3E12_03105 [Formicincola oecophyllae]|uniref:Uncharacterized protein n=1 Tax=Formicincola oecophyllae TaxID=2558361 RepID=A0A4Y6UB55_9PROT|nr:hypothetical protein [Formicincola oecophyllae]QDH13355.1 hypothetical protein E3E12_03105 [Formicincola oecophyllae]
MHTNHATTEPVFRANCPVCDCKGDWHATTKEGRCECGCSCACHEREAATMPSTGCACSSIRRHGHSHDQAPDSQDVQDNQADQPVTAEESHDHDQPADAALILTPHDMIHQLEGLLKKRREIGFEKDGDNDPLFTEEDRMNALRFMVAGFGLAQAAAGASPAAVAQFAKTVLADMDNSPKVSGVGSSAKAAQGRHSGCECGPHGHHDH